jgi:hypothetical protein
MDRGNNSEEQMLSSVVSSVNGKLSGSECRIASQAFETASLQATTGFL